MADNITFPCPACGTKYNVSASHAGKKTKCKKCQAPMTVPTPEVANPTIVGGTRTIRRADIDSVISDDTNAPEREVDMSGGASVMRKDETVVAAPPAAAPRRPTGPAPRPGTRPHPQGRPAGGRPMPPRGGGHAGHPHAPPQKKSNMGMILGIVGGAVGVILLVVIIAVAASDSGTATQGNDIAGTTDGGADKGPSEKEKLLTELQQKINNASTMSLKELEGYYEKCKKHKDDPAFESQWTTWARELANRATVERAETQADIGLLLHKDGFESDAMPLLEKASKEMEHTKEGRDGARMVSRPRKKFLQVVDILGWKPYKRPEVFAEYELWGVKGLKAYNAKMFEVPERCLDVERVTPDLLEEIQKLEDVVRKNGEALRAQDKKDGYAITARRAFLRFLEANQNGQWDRAKNKRPFCPRAMGYTDDMETMIDPDTGDKRDVEVDDIWTYTYYKPFILYVEKDVEDKEIPEELKDDLMQKAELMRQLMEWFDENMIQKFGLKRVLPLGPGGTGLDGKYYKTKAELAEAEGWPLTVMVLKDEPSFAKFLEEMSGGRAPAGARAFYSPAHNHVVTYDDRGTRNPDAQWFNESVLIHESFHLLSAQYAADPPPKGEEGESHMRYPNILIQEGLTDAVAGFRREGEGKSAKYKFMEVNHLRLKSHQRTYKDLENKNIWRIQDMLQCTHYGQVQQLGYRRACELTGRRLHPSIASFTMGLYYATSCQMVYFFQNYEEDGEYPYRDKWWEYVGRNYKGEMKLVFGYPQEGIKHFKEIFEIESDADYDEINKKFNKFVMDLDPEDVGDGYKEDSGTIEEKEDESDDDGLPENNSEQHATEQHAWWERRAG